MAGWETKTSKLRLREEKVIIDERTKNYQDILNKGITHIEYQRFREKGIDVKIAADLIVGAVDKKYDTAILLSSDTDLIPSMIGSGDDTIKKWNMSDFLLLHDLRSWHRLKPDV